MNKLGMFATGCLAGVVFTVAATKMPVRTLSISTLASATTSFITYLIVDTKKQNRLNEAEQKASDNRCKLQKTQGELDSAQVAVKQLTDEATKMKEMLSIAKKGLENYESDSEKSRLAIADLVGRVNSLEAELASCKIQLDEKDADIQAMQENFEDIVQEEAQKLAKKAEKTRIQEVFQEHDEITSQAMHLFRQLQGWGMKVQERHQTLKETARELRSQYAKHIDEYTEKVSKEREALLQQIEILNERIGLLQHQLAGDLVEPQYLECGFDESGRIANALANWLWVNRKIPLKVTGFEAGADGTLTAGFTYSRSTPPEAILKVIEGDSPTIARNLGLYALEKPIKLQVTDCLTVKVRRSRPTRKTDKGNLYRSKEEFIKYILSQPVRLRVIGVPGAGKTPTVAVLLSHILKRGFLSANTPNGQKLPYTVVEFCNPLAGISVKNGDDLDFCLTWNSCSAGFKGLTVEYRFRKKPENANYKSSVGYIWVCDEFDIGMADMTKDEAEPFKKALKDGGHVNLGVIVMGQSANISTSKGLSIDDQKMMTNIYIDAVSIRTFLTQYGERFYSKKAVEKALATLEELELEIEEQNEIICDTAREFRIAMVTANRSPVFYQLPYFDSVDIDVEGYQQILTKVSGIRSGWGETPTDASVSTHSQDVVVVSTLERRDESGRPPYAGLETGRDGSDKPTCPHCGSTDIRSKGNSWLCQNLEHSIVAPNKPKSWKK
jgi:hypothetical protein